MGFFSSVLGKVGGAILGRGVSKITNKIFGDPAKKGARIEDQSYVRRANFDWSKAQERGLTAQEFYGSPAAGGSSGGSGSGQVLGNNQTAMMQKMADQQFQAEQNELDRQNELDKAGISAEATLGSSKISAEASRYQAELQNAVEQGKLDLSQREFNEVTLPAAAEKLKLTREQTKKAINEVVTSTPKFQRSKILLQMGVDNTIQTALLQRFGIDITSKEEMAKLSDEQFQNVLSVLIASGSASNRELQGVLGAFSTAIGMIGVDEDKFKLSPIGTQNEDVNLMPALKQKQILGRRNYFGN